MLYSYIKFDLCFSIHFNITYFNKKIIRENRKKSENIL